MCLLHVEVQSLHHLHKANDPRVMDMEWDVWLTPGYQCVRRQDMTVGKDVGVKALPRHGARHKGTP